MRNLQQLSTRYPHNARLAGYVEPASNPSAPKALLSTLNEMESLVAQQDFSQPDALTQDRITAYALALMSLREHASAAGLDRLTRACDALAVTVARLIEDRSCACRTHCETLKRFVAHAQEMVWMAADGGEPHALRSLTAVPLRRR
jgi:hypothetical protein